MEEHSGRREHAAGDVAARAVSKEAAAITAVIPAPPAPPRLRSILRVRPIALPVEAGSASRLLAATVAIAPGSPAVEDALEPPRSQVAARLCDVQLAGSPASHALWQLELGPSIAPRWEDAGRAAAPPLPPPLPPTLPPPRPPRPTGQLRRIKWGDEHGHALATVSNSSCSVFCPLLRAVPRDLRDRTPSHHPHSHLPTPQSHRCTTRNYCTTASIACTHRARWQPPAACVGYGVQGGRATLREREACCGGGCAAALLAFRSRPRGAASPLG